jgi:hypothetical protein
VLPATIGKLQINPRTPLFESLQYGHDHGGCSYRSSSGDDLNGSTSAGSRDLNEDCEGVGTWRQDNVLNIHGTGPEEGEISLSVHLVLADIQGILPTMSVLGAPMQAGKRKLVDAILRVCRYGG